MAEPTNANVRRSGSYSELIGDRGITLNFGEVLDDERTLYMPTFNRTSQVPDIRAVGTYASPEMFDVDCAFQITEIKV